MAIIISSHLLVSAFVKNECFLGIKVAILIVYCCYIPTDYKNLASEEKFSHVSIKLAKSLQQCVCAFHRVILAGDVNLLVPDHSRSQILLSALSNLYVA